MCERLKQRISGSSLIFLPPLFLRRCLLFHRCVLPFGYGRRLLCLGMSVFALSSVSAWLSFSCLLDYLLALYVSASIYAFRFSLLLVYSSALVRARGISGFAFVAAASSPSPSLLLLLLSLPLLSSFAFVPVAFVVGVGVLLMFSLVFCVLLSLEFFIGRSVFASVAGIAFCLHSQQDLCLRLRCHQTGVVGQKSVVGSVVTRQKLLDKSLSLA